MKVKIIKCSNTYLWYAGRIGDVFEVKDYPPNHWQVLNTINTINKLNCEILPETSNELEQIAEQIAELRARMDELEAQIAAKPPAVPHWRDTVSEKNPVLVTYGDRKSSLLDGIMCFCTDYRAADGYWTDQEWWKYAKRVPQSVVEKILAGYSTTSEEE